MNRSTSYCYRFRRVLGQSRTRGEITCKKNRGEKLSHERFRCARLNLGWTGRGSRVCAICPSISLSQKHQLGERGAEDPCAKRTRQETEFNPKNLCSMIRKERTRGDIWTRRGGRNRRGRVLRLSFSSRSRVERGRGLVWSKVWRHGELARAIEAYGVSLRDSRVKRDFPHIEVRDRSESDWKKCKTEKERKTEEQI